MVLWHAATLALRVSGADAPLATVFAPDHEFLQAEGGSLAPGPYELVAHADGLDSAPLAAQGGDADLELVLPAQQDAR